MKIADMLNPTTAVSQLHSPPLSPESSQQVDYYPLHHHNNSKRGSTCSISSAGSTGSNNGKPRSRFSNMEDAIICEGVSRGLTWGQISGQLPHRKRATCFNRYRTLQGIRKSRKRSMPDMQSPPVTPPTPSSWSPRLSDKHRHSYHGDSNNNNQLPALVAPLPTRLPLPYPYADRIH